MLINAPIFTINLFKNKKISYKHINLKLDFLPFNYIIGKILLIQIKKHIQLLRRQDQALFKFGFHDTSGHLITSFARERGIITISCYETLKYVMANDWVNVCIKKKFNDNTMLWYAVMNYDFLRNANKE